MTLDFGATTLITLSRVLFWLFFLARGLCEFGITAFTNDCAEDGTVDVSSRANFWPTNARKTSGRIYRGELCTKKTTKFRVCTECSVYRRRDRPARTCARKIPLNGCFLTYNKNKKNEKTAQKIREPQKTPVRLHFTAKARVHKRARSNSPVCVCVGRRR